MRRAALGELQGAGDVVSREKHHNARLYRGSFAFKSKDEEAVVELYAKRHRILYEGMVDGEQASLTVMIVAVSIESGIAYLEAAAEGP